MSVTITPPTRTVAMTNEAVELARYAISAGERVIRGQRVMGVVRLTDVPANGQGRHYVIERELTSMTELRAIVDDYLRQASRWDAVPAEPCGLDVDSDGTPDR